jgi:ABC-type sugar transport system permease subunit
MGRISHRPEETVSTRTAARPYHSRYKRLWGLLLISPWLLGLLLFKLVPILTSLGFSFTNAFLLEPDETAFVGFRNYLHALTDHNGWTAMWNTALLALWTIPLQTGASLFVAALLNSKRLRMKNALRVLFFLPSIIPSAAATFMWQGFIRPGSGWLYTLILGPLGLGEIVRISSRSPTSGLIVLASLWTIGPGILIILGAMQGIPAEVHEAAIVDGANRLRRFFSITLPLVSPAAFFSLVLNLTAIFGGAILLDRGRAFNSNMSSYDNYIHYVLFRNFRLGEATSLAWLYFLVVMLLLLVLFWTSRAWVYFPDKEA